MSSHRVFSNWQAKSQQPRQVDVHSHFSNIQNVSICSNLLENANKLAIRSCSSSSPPSEEKDYIRQSASAVSIGICAKQNANPHTQSSATNVTKRDTLAPYHIESSLKKQELNNAC